MKTIVITGAGSGIGRATAIELSKQADIRLILVGRTETHLEQTRTLCHQPEQHHAAPLDILSLIHI